MDHITAESLGWRVIGDMDIVLSIIASYYPGSAREGSGGWSLNLPSYWTAAQIPALSQQKNEQLSRWRS